MLVIYGKLRAKKRHFVHLSIVFLAWEYYNKKIIFSFVNREMKYEKGMV